MNTTSSSHSTIGSNNSSSAGYSNRKRFGRQCLTLQRTTVLRVFFVISLLLAAAVCGGITYWVIQDLEEDVGAQTYESVAASCLHGAMAIAKSKIEGGEAISSIVGNSFPNASDWPFVSLRRYTEIASRVARLSSSTSQALITLLRPDQAAAFEEFAYKSYRELDYPASAGYSDFGFGIFRRNESHSPGDPGDGRVHVLDGNTTVGSDRTIMAPVFQHNLVNATSLLFDVHSDVFRGTAIDSVLDCVEEANRNRASTTVSLDQFGYPLCGVVTSFVELLVRPGPAALIYQPVFAVDTQQVVAFIGTSIHWAEVLTNVVPDYVDGLDCVISTGTTSYTYVIHNGDPKLRGVGDLHDRHYTHLGHSVHLNSMAAGAVASQRYTLTVYPTSLMLSQFSTNSPWVLSTGFVAILVFCILIFFLYDFFMMSESYQRAKILGVKRRFVRFISHEIRTPLNTVVLGLELLKSELEEQERESNAFIEEQQGVGVTTEGDAMAISSEPSNIAKWIELTSDIRDNTDNAISILNDLLNYDKIEDGSLKLEVGMVPILELIERVVGQFQVQAKKKELNLSLIVIPETNDGCAVLDESGMKLRRLHVIGDEIRIAQILRNLISNALKFTREGGHVELRVSMDAMGLQGPEPLLVTDFLCQKMARQTDLERAGSIHICVQDDGAGLSPIQLEQLFTEGTQFDANRLQSGGGSGLGLFIARGLVLQHGGTITAHSDGIGHGTSFSIELPVFDMVKGGTTSTSMTSRVSRTSRSYSASTIHESPRRILIVDDAAMNRKMLMRVLQREGHTCVLAEHGQRALDIIREELATSSEKNAEDWYPFDTILIDYEMPVLNGPDTAKTLREQGCPALIIGITGNVLAEDVAHFKDQGADEVLAKPFPMEVLRECWRKLGSASYRVYK